MRSLHPRSKRLPQRKMKQPFISEACPAPLVRTKNPSLMITMVAHIGIHAARSGEAPASGAAPEKNWVRRVSSCTDVDSDDLRRS
jgi:hypothetical protein